VQPICFLIIKHNLAYLISENPPAMLAVESQGLMNGSVAETLEYDRIFAGVNRKKCNHKVGLLWTAAV
jgi:hypothetical protein